MSSLAPSAAAASIERWAPRTRRSRLRAWVVAAVLVGSFVCVRGHAQNLPAPVRLDGFERQAARLFDRTAITNDGSAFITAADRLLFIAQGLSAAIIVAGMITRLRKDHEPMEGIASMMLKVAFIATVPFWRTFTLETADLAADAVGYRATSTAGELSPVMTEMWRLAGEWLPAGSPYLDVLQTQASATPPSSGHEWEWSLEAWNWARGVGAVTGDQLQVFWQGFSGGLRAAMVLGGCAVMAGLVLLTVFLTYAGEVLRYLLYYGGCALLPVAIAGLGLEAFRRQSVRFVLGVAAVAIWPIAWALWNTVTKTVLAGALDWMGTMTTTALALPPNTNPAPSVATAAPFLAWAGLIVFAAVTALICLWSLAGLLLAPLAVGRLSAAGSQVIGGWAGFLPSTANPTISVHAPQSRSTYVERTPSGAGPVTVVNVEQRTAGPTAVATAPRVFEHREMLRPAVSRESFDRRPAIASVTERVPAWFPPPAARADPKRN